MRVSFFRNAYYRNGCYDNAKTQIKISFLHEIQGFFIDFSKCHDVFRL